MGYRTITTCAHKIERKNDKLKNFGWVLIPKKKCTFTPTNTTNHKSKFPIDCVFWKSKLYPWFFVPIFFFVTVDSKLTHLLSEINLNKLPKKQKSYTKKGPLKILRERTSATDLRLWLFSAQKRDLEKIFDFRNLHFFGPTKISPLSL